MGVSYPWVVMVNIFRVLTYQKVQWAYHGHEEWEDMAAGFCHFCWPRGALLGYLAESNNKDSWIKKNFTKPTHSGTSFPDKIGAKERYHSLTDQQQVIHLNSQTHR